MTHFPLFYGLLLVSIRSDPLLHGCTCLAYKLGFITEFNSSKWLWGQRWLLLYGMVSSTKCCDVFVLVGEFMIWASCGNTGFRRKIILCILAALNKKKGFAEQYVHGWLKSLVPQWGLENRWHLGAGGGWSQWWWWCVCAMENIVHAGWPVHLLFRGTEAILAMGTAIRWRISFFFFIHQGSLILFQA